MPITKGKLGAYTSYPKKSSKKKKKSFGKQLNKSLKTLQPMIKSKRY